MKVAFQILFVALSLGVAACTVHFFYSFFKDPDTFNDADLGILRGRNKAVYYTYLGCAWIGIGIAIYAAASAFLFWIPQSWTRLNEDGEREWMGHMFALLASFFGTTAIITGMSSLAGKFARLLRKVAELEREVDYLERARKRATESGSA